MSHPDFRNILTESIRFWERMRIVYNLALVLIVIGCYIIHLPESQAFLSIKLAVQFVILSAIANVLFCAAYPVDLVVQYSHLRSGWLRYRFGLFLAGMLFASLLTMVASVSSFIESF